MTSWASIVSKSLEEPPLVQVSSLLEKISSIEQELIKRKESFESSFAYTKYKKETDILQKEKHTLELQVVNLWKKQERAEIEHVFTRILDYLGLYYKSNYETPKGYAMTYSLTKNLPVGLFPLGFTWGITEQRKCIHISFHVDSNEIFSNVESFIQQYLDGFTKKNEC